MVQSINWILKKIKLKGFINISKKLKDKNQKRIDEYPDASNKDIEKHVELVKKMKGGKLC